MEKKKFNIVKEIRQHEKKYTFILVVLFIFIIIFTGYCILSIDNKTLTANTKSINYRYSSLSSSFQKITLTNKNIMNDTNGLNSNKVSIHIENDTNEKYSYKVVLKKDERTTQACGCDNNINDSNYIRYSIDGNISKLNKDMVIYNGTLNKDEEKDLLLNIWVDRSILDITNNYHYHGYFSIEKINQD